jgi:isopenicillin N synthase-like dioxygenase
MSAALDRACAEFGFFYVTGHGIDPELSELMMRLAAKALSQHLERHRLCVRITQQ